MAPMEWQILLAYILFLMLLFMSKVFFYKAKCLTYSPFKLGNMMKPTKLNWKW